MIPEYQKNESWQKIVKKFGRNYLRFSRSNLVLASLTWHTPFLELFMSGNFGSRKLKVHFVCLIQKWSKWVKNTRNENRSKSFIKRMQQGHRDQTESNFPDNDVELFMRRVIDFDNKKNRKRTGFKGRKSNKVKIHLC